jgi:hypothetical protein
VAGTFSKNARPKRPGAYFNFVVQQQEPTLVNTDGVVLVAAKHSWGPPKQAVQVESWADWLGVFGRGSADQTVFTDGYKAAFDAFRGEGVDGRGGAGAVIFYRLLPTDAAKASASISNGTTNAITLTAVYEGLYGNQISYETVPDPTDPTTSDNLVLFVEGIEVERYKYAKTNITDLAAQVNGTTPYAASRRSQWVVASAVTSGTALTGHATAVAFTGGLDGGALVAGDYTAMMTAVEPLRFSLFAPYNLLDKTVILSLADWCDTRNAKGKRFMAIFGGAPGEVFADAANGGSTIAGAADLDSPNIIRIGIGTFTDDRFGDLGTAQLTTRTAGILAWRGEALALTYARLAGLTIKAGPSDQDAENAPGRGLTVLARDSHPTAPVRFETAVTTYTDVTNVDMPVSIFGNPKFIRTMQGIETELTEFAEANVIGLLPVNAGTRDYLRGQMSSRMQARQDAGVIQSGWTVKVATQPPPSDDDDFVALDYAIKFGRSLDQILNTVVVG